MTDSILESVKGALGIDTNETHFDPDVIMAINTTFFKLTQIGVGPENGFVITGNTETWSSFLGGQANRYSAIKTYLYLSVRLIFDPPTQSFLLEAYKEQIKELEWRLNVLAEHDKSEEQNTAV